jgi:hypothetical protein
MAGGNGHGSQVADPELLEDLDAFIPRPVARLKFSGKAYDIPHFRDLYVGDVLAFIALLNEEGGTSEESFERAWKRLKLLAPTLPDEARGRLTFNAIERVLGKATESKRAESPPAPSGAGSGSASPSPSIVASTPATASAT